MNQQHSVYSRKTFKQAFLFPLYQPIGIKYMYIVYNGEHYNMRGGSATISSQVNFPVIGLKTKTYGMLYENMCRCSEYICLPD